MNRLKIALAAVAAVGAAAVVALPPAVTVAQPMDAPAAHHDWSLHERAEWLRTRLDQARTEGAISPDEFRRVRGEIDNITGDDTHLRAVSAGELTQEDRNDLQRRLDAVADQIHWLRATNLQRPW